MQAIRIKSPCLNDRFFSSDREQEARRITQDQTRADGDTLHNAESFRMTRLGAINPSDPTGWISFGLLRGGSRGQVLPFEQDVADGSTLPARQMPLITQRDIG